MDPIKVERFISRQLKGEIIAGPFRDMADICFASVYDLFLFTMWKKTKWKHGENCWIWEIVFNRNL